MRPDACHSSGHWNRDACTVILLNVPSAFPVDVPYQQEERNQQTPAGALSGKDDLLGFDGLVECAFWGIE